MSMPLSCLYRSVQIALRTAAPALPCLWLLSVGCVSQERYVLSRSIGEQVGTNSSAADATPPVPDVVPAVRERDRRPVFVKTAALQKETLSAHGEDSFRIFARGNNRLITAGSILTWAGTAISLVGTAVVIAGKVQDSTPLFYAGGITALSAEPIMGVGTGLWIAGALRLPFEVSKPAEAMPIPQTKGE